MDIRACHFRKKLWAIRLMVEQETEVCPHCSRSFLFTLFFDISVTAILPLLFFGTIPTHTFLTTPQLHRLFLFSVLQKSGKVWKRDDSWTYLVPSSTRITRHE